MALAEPLEIAILKPRLALGVGPLRFDAAPREQQGPTHRASTPPRHVEQKVTIPRLVAVGDELRQADVRLERRRELRLPGREGLHLLVSRALLLDDLPAQQTGELAF